MTNSPQSCSADIEDVLTELREEYDTAKDCDIFNLEPELLKRAADEIERLRKVEILHHEETKRSNAFEAECDRLRGLIPTDAQSVGIPVETYTEICKSPHCPRGGVPVEIVGSAVEAMRERNLGHNGSSAATGDALADLEQQFMHVLDGWEEDSSSPAAISALQYALGAVRDAMHRHHTAAPQSVPVQLTGEIACILEDCSPPEKQTPEALTALIEGYQPIWDRIRSALSRPERS